MIHHIKNAQEEALCAIARQLMLSNYVNALRELYQAGEITQNEYAERLKVVVNSPRM